MTAWVFCLGCSDVCNVATCQFAAIEIDHLYSVDMGIGFKYTIINVIKYGADH